MSLLRFLKVGRSLNAQEQRYGAYRVRYGLPKFNVDKSANVFQNEKNKTQLIKAGEVLPRANVTIEKRNDDAPRTRATRRSDWKPFTAVAELCGLTAGKLSKLNIFSKRPADSIFASKQAKSASVQAELTLDKVKVLRNDLSDADLEVVPLGAARAGQRKPKWNFESVAPPQVHFNQQTDELFQSQETQTH